MKFSRFFRAIAMLTFALASTASIIVPPNIYLTSPVDGMTGVKLAISARSNLVAGANFYTLELNTMQDFSGPTLTFTSSTNVFSVTGLAYNTPYYSQVKTNLNPNFGIKKSFTTLTSESLAYVKTPANNATGVVVNPNLFLNVVPGALTYTTEIDDDPNFGSPITISGSATLLQPTGLLFGTPYYTHVKTDLSLNFGPVKTFTTGTATSFTYVKTPANNATNQLTKATVILNTVPGANMYTVELNPDSNFGPGTAVVQSGSGTFYTFSNLLFSKTYYTRVNTNLFDGWGPTRSFTTATAQQLSYVTSPANNATNVSWTPLITVNAITAGSMLVELNTEENFSGASWTAPVVGGKAQFTNLSYNTVYFSRIRSEAALGTCANGCSTDLNTCFAAAGGNPDLFTACINQFSACSIACNNSTWGPTRKFTTGSPQSFSMLTSPINNSTNQKYILNLAAMTVPGAASYTIEANPDEFFAPETAIVKTGGMSQAFVLEQDTRYWVRVYTDLNDHEWGIKRSFTTGTTLSLTYVTTPRNGMTGVSTSPKVYANALMGANMYTIELNTSPTFDGLSNTLTGAASFKMFTGLANNTTYYARVQTNLTGVNFGPTTSFTTVNPAARVAESESTEEEVADDPVILSGDLQYRIYPIPSRDYFNVHVQSDYQEPLGIKIMDMTGREMLSAMHQTNRPITVGQDLTPGVYFLMVNTSTKLKTVRVMKTN